MRVQAGRGVWLVEVISKRERPTLVLECGADNFYRAVEALVRVMQILPTKEIEFSLQEEGLC